MGEAGRDTKPRPPRLARAFLARRLAARREEVLDDLDTLFEVYHDTYGPYRAAWRYRYEALSIGLLGLGEKTIRSNRFFEPTMYKNYLKIAFRTLLKHKGYSFINIAGLGIGMACCILILLYVNHEFSYDAFHTHANDIYRVQMDRFEESEKIFSSAVTFPMVGPTLYEERAEVVAYARLLPTSGVMQYEEAAFAEDNLFYADSSFLTLFSYPFLLGNPETALVEPNTAVLSASTARRYFGDANPIGETFTINSDAAFEVTGVFADIPANSHLDFDVLLSFSTLVTRAPDSQTSWSWYDFYTYLHLTPGTDAAALEADMTDFMAAHKAEIFSGSGRWETLRLQPLRDIHLYSNLSWEAGVNGDGTTVYFLLVIAVFILLIAWVNFINLSTARSMERAKEVGVRKTLGAPKSQLIRQFMLEALTVNVIAALLAVGLVYLTAPAFTRLAGTGSDLTLSNQTLILAGLVGVFLVGALLAGSYPSFFLSSFKPIHVLKTGVARLGRGAGFRKGMVVFQFAASIILIAGTLVVARQLDFLKTQDLGIDIEQTLVLRGPSVLPDRDAYSGQVEVFRNAALQKPGVNGFTASSTVPGKENFWIGGMRTERMASTDAKDLYIVGVDESFMEDYGLELAAGRFFSSEFGADAETFILNETAVHVLGLDTPEDALRERIVRGNEAWPIIGVLRDYHQASLKQGLDPVLFQFIPTIRSYYSIKVDARQAAPTIAALETLWKEVFPGNPYEYFFLDDFFEQQYRADRQFGQVFGLFAGLAIIVACLGLFGLASFSVQQRTKEIGVRKVLGASIPGIVGLLSREYAVLVLAANVLAWPVAYVVMDRWLDTFAYRIELGVFTFLAAGLTTLLIAGLTVSYNALKAARLNPVDSLRYE